VNNLEIFLTLDMIKALVEGHTIRAAVPDLDMMLTLRGSPDVTKSFRDTVNEAMLHLLPTPPGTH
jgi:hypothetical protein